MTIKDVKETRKVGYFNILNEINEYFIDEKQAVAKRSFCFLALHDLSSI